MAAASVTLFKHHPYDATVLAIPLCYALRHWRRPAAKLALFGIAYAWYLQKLAEYAAWRLYTPAWRYTFFVEFAALALLLAALWQLGASLPSDSSEPHVPTPATR